MSAWWMAVACSVFILWCIGDPPLAAMSPESEPDELRKQADRPVGPFLLAPFESD
jgi:hypothetical protein